jgi:hypothetical protein
VITDGNEQARRKAAPRLRIGQNFNPYKLFTGIFIPDALARYRGLSCGAKIAYGRLARFAGKNGECWPAVATLASEIGIGATQARAYIHELRDRRFIRVEQRPGTSGVYTFLWHEAFVGEIGNERKAPLLRITGGVPHRKSGDAPLRKTGPLPLRITGDEENQLKESHHQENQIKESRISASQKKASSSISIDDELQEVPVYGSPWEEVRAEFRKATGGVEMGYQDECWVKDQIELRGITPEHFVELVCRNPLSGFHTPMAGLKWLVKKFRTKTLSAVELASEAGATSPFLASVETPRCEKCGNTGRLLERVDGERPRVTDQYCDCRMGKEVLAVERRKPTATAPSDRETGSSRLPWRSAIAGGETSDHHAAS